MRGDEFFMQVAKRPPFTKLPPHVASFFKGYLAKEKVIRYGGGYVVNTNFPPYPSAAFDEMAEHFGQFGEAGTRRLYSVTLAVTNRCHFNCWHCYNFGRSQVDTPLPVLKTVAADLQALGAVMVTLTGGEPLLRDDLADIVQAFDQRSCLILGSTGDGLTAERARTLRTSGLFAVGISLDSDQEDEHDRLRGRAGAFRTAVRALQIARDNALYPYVVAVATREFLERKRFLRFMDFVGTAGASEVHLLEPNASGKLAGKTQFLLTAGERQRIFEYQAEVSSREDLPILSALAYLESGEAFGCGAGLTHLYIDGSGEVCPCNLVPLSFGNLVKEPLRVILNRMGRHFCQPRTGCAGRLLAKHFPNAGPPIPPAKAAVICVECLPKSHPLPTFFRVRNQGQRVGGPELRAAYDRVHQDYDDFWLVAAAAPIDDLVQRVRWTGNERVFEAGCGTGYATALLARHAKAVQAVDLSDGMLKEAQTRVRRLELGNVRLVVGDALASLNADAPFDVVFSSWVLGYIPLAPFFAAASRALVQGGQLAFIVHKENSPREPLEIFAELVAQDASALRKQVAFDFPRDVAQVRSLLEVAGFKMDYACDSHIDFHYGSARQVLDHLLKSGAGTAFYDALDPARRDSLTQRFLQRLAERQMNASSFAVRHDYLACVATRSPSKPQH